MKRYEFNGRYYYYREGEQPAGAVEVKAKKVSNKARKVTNKAAKKEKEADD